VLCSSPTTPTAPPTPCLVYWCPSSSRHHRGERHPVSLFPLLTPNPSHRATLFPWSPPCLASPTACQNRSGATDGRREDARRGFSPARLPQLGSNPVGSPIGLGQNWGKAGPFAPEPSWTVNASPWASQLRVGPSQIWPIVHSCISHFSFDLIEFPNRFQTFWNFCQFKYIRYNYKFNSIIWIQTLSLK
jgi:hypothetical protein